MNQEENKKGRKNFIGVDYDTYILYMAIYKL